MVTSRTAFAAGAAAGVVATLTVQRCTRRRSAAAIEDDASATRSAGALASLPHELDRDVDELSALVRAGTLEPSAAVLELFTARAHRCGALQRIDGPSKRGLYRDFRISTDPGWAAARRLVWGACRLLTLRPSRARRGCAHVAHDTGALTRCVTPPPPPPGSVRFVFVSDTHLRHRDLPPLPACDVLVHCGDALLQGGDAQPRDGASGAAECRARLADLDAWLSEAPARAVLLVGGNHDGLLERLGSAEVARLVPSARFLCGGDVVRVCGGLRVWGCGYSLGHGGANSAWQPEGAAREKVLGSVPSGIDVLITHGPPELPRAPFGKKGKGSFGCPGLLEASLRAAPAVHVFGHDHGAYGAARRPSGRTLYVCATSVVEGTLTAENPPIVLDVPIGDARDPPSC